MVYLENPNKLQAKYEAESLIFKFDEDNSGSLTLSEISTLFKQNGIEISTDQVRNMIEIVDPRNANSINMEKLHRFNDS